jgi:hypothetical protein
VPIEGTFVINDDASVTGSTSVALTIAVSGAEEMRFSNDEEQWDPWTEVADGYSWVLDPPDGPRTVFGEFRNASGGHLKTSDTIVLDTQCPAVEFDIAGGATVVASSTVTLSMTGSSVTKMRFRNSGGTWTNWEPYAETKQWNLAPGDGWRVVLAEFSDLAGNVCGNSRGITVDTTPPAVTSFTINNHATHTRLRSVTLGMDVSGATRMRFSNSSSSAFAWQDYSSSVHWTLPAGDGPKTVRGWFEDQAGNQTMAETSIILDTVPPTVNEFHVNGGAASTTDRAVILTSDVTGASEMRFRVSGGPSIGWRKYEEEYPYLVLPGGDGPKHIFAAYQDEAGNETAEVHEQINLDEERRIRLTVVKIQIIEDGDGWGKGAGEIYYGFSTFVYRQQHRTVVERSRDDAISRSDGEWIYLNESQLLTFPNQQVYYVEFSGYVYERDSGGTARCDLAKRRYTSDENWGTTGGGSYQETITGSGGLKVKIYWTIDYVS